MKYLILDLLGLILFHILAVLALGGLAMFIWNVGAVSLLSSLQPIEYLTAVAVISAIYIVDMVAKTYLNKITTYKLHSNLNKTLFQDEEKER